MARPRVASSGSPAGGRPVDGRADEAALVAVARIVRAQGLRGEVRLLPLTDEPARLAELTECYLVPPAAGERRPVEAVRFQGGVPVLKLAGSDERTAAEALVGRLVAIRREAVRALPPHHYYAFDLVGCAVQTPDGRTVGVLEDVEAGVAHDLWVVRVDGRACRIPAVSEIVERVDLAGRRILVRPPAGLLELEG